MNKLVRTLMALAMTASGLAIAGPASSALAAGSACQANSTLTESQTTAPAGSPVTLTATLKDCNGAGVAGATVTFSQTSGPCQSTFSSTTAVTDANGKASVTVTPNCAGQFVYGVQGAGVTLQSTLAATSGGAFPATSAPEPTSSLPLFALLAGFGMICAASVALLARRRSS